LAVPTASGDLTSGFAARFVESCSGRDWNPDQRPSRNPDSAHSGLVDDALESPDGDSSEIFVASK